MPDNIRNILVVDDEKEIRDLLKDFLEGNHFHVTLAADGLKALELIEENIPGIAIIDLLLPGEHGINLIKTIKEKYFIPIIIISSIYRREEIKPVMDEYFVEDFFEKPIDLKELLKKINTIINAKTV
ncbi:MAG: response regulator [Candidatus Aminicenantes bacterium]|nr:MAG: response regulator [Candidatus Aminicenantes bacterium]